MSKSLLSSTLLLAFWLCSITAWAQRTVTGRVTSSEDGSGLPGVNVVLKGTTVGTATNIDGNYSLAVPDDPNAVIVFSSIGFKSQERAIGTSSSIDVILEIDVAKLDEAVVIGYGSTTKKDLTGSVASVTSKDFQKGIISTPDQLISGKVAGVQITPNGGGPGTGSTIRIRGTSSLNASQTPLIVIDGVPVDNAGVAGSPNPLSLINPNEIESFSILKDASATAIYGSRASNGVIMITTKRGTRNSKMNISLTSQHSISVIRNKVDVLTGDQLRAIVDSNGTPAQKKLLGTANTDWQKQIWQPAYSTDNNLALSGGLDLGKEFSLPYRLSGNYLSQNGILKTDYMQRLSAGLNLTPTFLDNHLKVDLNLKASQTQNRFANTGAIGSAIVFDPTKPVRADTVNPTTGEVNNRFGGYWEWVPKNSRVPNNLAPKNPLGLLMQQENRSVAYRYLTNAKIDYAIHGFEALHFNLNLGNDYQKGNGNVVINDSAASNYSLAGKGSRSHYASETRSQVMEAYLDYNKQFGDFRLDAVVGHAWQNFIVTTPNFRSYYYNGDTIKGNVVQFKYGLEENTLVSYFGRLNLNYAEKYMVTGSLRSDESSRFAPGNRVAVFPALAASWRVSGEKLFNKIREKGILTDFKLRFGYGQTGQQDGIGRYDYIGNYSLSNINAQYQFGYDGNGNPQFYQGYRPGPYNANIKWEQTTTFNYGADVSLLKDRLSGSFDFYVRKTSDLLNRVPVAAGSNFSNFLTSNVGSLENHGVEIALNGVPVQTKDMQLTVGVNFTANQNKITKLNNREDPSNLGTPVGSIAGGTGTTIQIQAVGAPINSFFVYEQRYDSTGKPSGFVDQNGDGKLNELDKIKYKSPNPKFFMGLNLSFTYKRLSLSTVLRGSFGGYVYNNVQSNTGSYSSYTGQPSYLNGGSSNYLETGFQAPQLLSSYYVQEANFVRMDNINIAYNLGTLVKGLGNIAVNANFQNVFVITKYKGLDPEISGGIDNNFYPRPRVFSLGLAASLR